MSLGANWLSSAYYTKNKENVIINSRENRYREQTTGYWSRGQYTSGGVGGTDSWV